MDASEKTVHAESAVVVFKELPAAQHRKIGTAELNVPATLNSLTTEMVEQLLQQLLVWQSDSSVVCVMISGSGEKAFCAGGDVQALRNSSLATPGGPCVEAENFFAREYRLDYLIHTFGKPVVVWGDGIVMGGGLGIFAGASHRVVTETSRFAMPEVSIGLYPDVGGSFFLNQMPAQVGRFLALTGAAFNAADALYVGIADVFIQRSQFDTVLAKLQGGAPATHDAMSMLLTSCRAATVDETTADEATATVTPTVGNIEPHIDTINALCSGDNIETVFERIATLQTDDAWLLKAQKTLLQGSPLSVVLIDLQLARSVGQPLAKVLNAELLLSTNIIRYPEFAEGVRALLVDKDRKPKWQFSNIAAIPEALIESFFSAPWQESPLADL